MSLFGGKNSGGKSAGNTYADGFSKTEPVANPGAAFMAGMDSKAVPPTMQATGLVDTDQLFGAVKGGGSGIESYRPTEAAGAIKMESGETVNPVVGWLVCIKGVNFGKEYRIHSDYNYVGSASGDVVIQGDPKISHEKHMLITYDSEARKFYVSPFSGSNMVRLNDKALVGGAEELHSYDVIRTGDSTFMFIAFCGPEFNWDQVSNG